MKIVILLAILAVARNCEGFSKPLLSTHRQPVDNRGFKSCGMRVVPYPLNGKSIQVDDSTSHEARSSYNNFLLHVIKDKVTPSEFNIAVEYKDPELLIEGRNVQVKWNNLLLTASLSILERDYNCDATKNTTLFGFVELVQTDTAWYKDGHTVNECREKNLATNNDLQYVLTKLIPHSRYIFANDTVWGKAHVWPRSYGYMVPLKYESSENIVIDYEKYPNTIEYERLIKKKIFLIEINQNSEVLKVIAGVDVTMYIDCTYDITAVTTDGHIRVNKSHSLIQRIANPEKYSSIIEESTRNIRDRKLSFRGWFQNPGVHTLNPFIHMYTQ